MTAEKIEFISNIEPRFNRNSDETVLESIFQEYEHVVFKSIITAFGLDLFIKDQYGGDVDTIHTVREIDADPRMHYKNTSNQESYENREVYSHKLVEGAGSNFQRIKHEARQKYYEDPKQNTVQDAYEDKPLGFLGRSKGHPTDKSAELDHVISAKKIHDDRGRVLSGLTAAELADSEDNLKWTNEHLNKSMNAEDIPDYIAAHPELPEDVKARMQDAYNQAKASYEKKIEKAYYFDFSNPQCRQFYKATALAARNRGLQMGVRQAIGFLMTDLWFSIKDAMQASDGTVNGILNAASEGIKGAWDKIKVDYKEILEEFGEGFLSGVFASFTSTLCNTFLTITENTGKILREAWSSIVEATSIILFNDKQQYLCDRMTSSAKVLATGASMIIGTSIQTQITAKLSETPIHKDLVNIISTFAGSLCTGILSVTFLFYIDNGPFTKFLVQVNSEINCRLAEQNRMFKAYCADLRKIDTEKMIYEANCIYTLAQKLGKASDQNETSAMLQKTMKDLGVTSVLGELTLDACMQNHDWVLEI